MDNLLHQLEVKLASAVESFWRQRNAQGDAQGGSGGVIDRSDRRAVTGGKHLDGFRELVADVLVASGIQRATVFWRRKTELPGWFRAEKSWDLLVVVDGQVIAIVEFKSQVGSFGNNFNNRTEESLGNATDLWAAYEEGAFRPSARPWLGYFMLLEDAMRLLMLPKARRSNPRSRQGAALPSLPGISFRVLCHAIRDVTYQTGAYSLVRRGLLDSLVPRQRVYGRIP